MAKTYKEINEKIRAGKAVVFTAEEIIEVVAEEGLERAAEKVDVVTTGTFGPMCSSGAFFNVGHSNPKIRMSRAWLNGVPAYCGIAAVDLFLGATELPDGEPSGDERPYQFTYGGGHVISEFVAGKTVKLKAIAYGTDCYPRKEVEAELSLATINQAYLFNPRNAYQNYNVAVNASDRTIYTYMGVLRPELGNANYSSAAQLSPLMNDPLYRTIGIGTRLFLGGGVGYIAWEGTQHSPAAPRTQAGVPTDGAGTLALIGDLKQMDPGFLVGTSFLGYGATMTVGVGLPIPILDAETLRYTTVTDADIFAPVVDYSSDYPNCKPSPYGTVSYAELKSGVIDLGGREVPTASLSSYAKAQEIAGILKEWITRGEFLLAEPMARLPGPDSGRKSRPMPGVTG